MTTTSTGPSSQPHDALTIPAPTEKTRETPRYRWNCAIATVLLWMTAGCSVVQPWDRDLLATSAMQPIPDALEFSADEKIYFSKEGSSGGAGVGGGGCGCN